MRAIAILPSRWKIAEIIFSSRIRVASCREGAFWHSQKDKGQADAINQGMNLSSADILCWLNSDDMYLPGTLLDIGKKFVGHSEENYLIYGGAVTINQNNEQISSGCQTAATFEKFRLTYEDFIVQPSSFYSFKYVWIEF